MRRWLRNGETTTRNEQAQYLYWFLSYVCEFILVDISDTTHWPRLATGTNGIVNAAAPFTFKTPITHPYAFTVADIGRRIALRDNLNAKNSGIYRITAVVNAHEIHLAVPLASFVGSNTNVNWVLFTPTAAPPDGAWFVIQSPVIDAPWQARVVVAAAPPSGVTIDLGAMGGWSIATHAWVLPASNPVVLLDTNPFVFTFAVADEKLGAFFVWAEDAIPNRSGVFCGQFGAIHRPQGLSVPKDQAPVAILGDNTINLNTLNRWTSGPLAGFAIHGQVTLPDLSGYADAYLHAWKRINDGVDFFIQLGAALDP